MHVNNLGGARIPTSVVDRSTSTAQTRFSTLVQGGAAAPAAGRAGISGSNILAAAIAVNHGGTPGSGFGAPYLQATPGSGAAPAPSQAPGTPGAEFNGELQMMSQKQQEMMAIRELVKMSLMSFISGTFSMGQNRPQLERDDS